MTRANTAKRGKWGRRLRMAALVVAALVVGTAIWATIAYRDFMSVPTTRLALDEHYPEMPPDERHHYLNLPVDHQRDDSPHFRAFYVLSPGFSPAGPVVFFLTDGQMELVGTNPDFSWFDKYLGGVSYVLIGHRGHAPSQLPEVFTDEGDLDLRAAMNLYGSWQYVEDIERVRQDMQRKRLLPPDAKISVFGASGAGVVTQQLLHRHGQHITRAVIQASGAPDLAQANGWQYSPSFAAFNPDAAARLRTVLEQDRGIDRASLAYLLFQAGRKANEPRREQMELVAEIADGDRAFQYGWVGPSRNLRMTRWLLTSPSSAAVKVRMFELLGHDLRGYHAGSSDLHLINEWAIEVLADFVAAEREGRIEIPDLELQRSAYTGEVLVLAADEDVVFSTTIAEAIQEAYPSARLAVLHGGHSEQGDPEFIRELRVEFLRGGFGSEAFERRLADARIIRTRP